jgi:hypothetical protein
MTELPLACTLQPGELSKRVAGLEALRIAVQAVQAIEGGYAFRFQNDDAVLDELIAFIKVERKCCAFLNFKLRLASEYGEVWLELYGPTGTQEFLAQFLLPEAS